MIDYEIIPKVPGCMVPTVGVQCITAKGFKKSNGSATRYTFYKSLPDMIDLLENGVVIVLIFSDVCELDGKNLERLSMVCCFHAATGGTGHLNVLTQLKELEKSGKYRTGFKINPAAILQRSPTF